MNLKKLFSMITLGVLFSCEAHAQVITLNAGTLKQSINLMGGDMERSAGFLNNASNAQTVADWVYKDINFTVSRVSFDKKQELVEGTANMATYTNAIAGMQKVKISRPTIKFWATLKSDYAGYGVENNLPNWIYTGAGYNGGTYDPNLLDSTKYARFLADYLKHMNTNGVPITYMSVSKEWKQVFTATVEKNTIDALKTLLATAPYTGVPVPLFVGPAGWGVVGSTDFMADVATVGSSSLYAGFSTHDYDLPTATQWGSFTAAVATTGKPAWSDESASGANSPTSGAEPAISVPIAAYLNKCAYYRKGLKGELFFEQWSRGVTTETRSIYFTSGQAGVRLRGYYIMKHFANNAAGSSYLDSTKTGLADVETMAFRQGNKITLWVINNSTTDINNVTFNITGATMTTAAIVRTNWNATNAATGVVASATKNSNIQFVNSIASQQLIAYEFWVN